MNKLILILLLQIWLIIGLQAQPTSPSDLVEYIGFNPSARSIGISWTSNSASSEFGFVIERSAGDNTNFVEYDITARNLLNYEDKGKNTVTGLDVNTTYFYRIAAYDGDGNSSYSNEFSSTTGFAFNFDVIKSASIAGDNNSCFSDIDSDGDVDVLYSPRTSNPGSQVMFFENQNGVFSSAQDLISESIESPFLLTVDLNNDSHLDILNGDNIYRYNIGTETYDKLNISISRPSFGDVNKDSKLDYATDEGFLFLSSSDSDDFQSSDLSATGIPYFFDMDNDGDLDLLFSSDNPLNQLFENIDGFFSLVDGADLTDAFITEEILLGDLNNDGFIDVLEKFSADAFINNQLGGFIKTTLSATDIDPFALLDIDNDGYLDFFNSDVYYSNDVIFYKTGSRGQFYKNNKDLTFSGWNNILDNGVENVLKVNPNFGDWNDDGLLDMAVFSTNSGGGVLRLYEAYDIEPLLTTHPWFENNWVKFSLNGFAVSNPQAIGARVNIHYGNQMQSKQILLTYDRQQSDPRAHFGLGAITVVDSVMIYWPSGLMTKIEAPAINTVHTIHESVELSIDNLVVSDSILTGQDYPITFDIENSGHLDAGAFNYQIFLSEDQLVNNTDSLAIEGTINDLVLFSSSSIQTSFQAQEAINSFNYLLVFIDVDGVHKERNEEDNLITIPILVNNEPSDILISNLNLLAGARVDSIILDLATQDLDDGETYIYQMIDGAGSDDNEFFQIIANQLAVKLRIPNVIEQSVFKIRIKVDDGRGGLMEKTFELNSIPDEVPPSFTNLKINSASVSISSSASLTASVEIDDNVEVNSVKVYVNGVSGDFSEVGTVLTVSSDSYSYTFDAITIVDVAGIAVYFEATDIFGNTSHSDTLFTSFIYPEISVPIVQGGSVTNYQIMAFPIASEASVSTVLEDDLGAYEINSWRLFTYENGTDLEYKNGFTSVKSGQGYWLISKKSAEIDMPGLTAASSADITLRSGWNQIGNPFVAGLDWNEVINYNIQAGTISAGDIGNLIGYNSQFLETTNISAYEGAFVESANAVTIHIPRSSIDPAGRISKHYTYPIQNSNLNEDQWFVPITLGNQEYTYTLAGFGMHPDAIDQKDIFDLSTPPKLPIFSEIEYTNEWIEEGKMTRSVVSTKDQASWRFVVNTNLEDSQLLSWDNSNFGTSPKELYLLDELNNELIDMKLINDYIIQANKHNGFKVIFGEKDFILSQIGEFSKIMNLYPNPAKGQFTIPFVTGEGAHVYMVLVDINGRVIDKLLDTLFEPGFHDYHWSSHESQVGIKEGLYFLNTRIQTGERVVKQTIKILLKE